MKSPPTLPPILIVEDSADDLFLIRRLFAKAGVKNPIVTFEDGSLAQEFLKGAGSVPNGHLLPCVIFTDLKMPRMNGFEFFEWVRKQKALRQVKVIMMSGSGHASDVKRAKELGIDRYLVKLPKPEVITEIVGSACKNGAHD
jgi:CheY-like chemotaxis protein